MPLDSDISNADAQLHVEFYVSTEPQYAGFDFVRIMVPGDKTNIVVQPVNDGHKQRFARQWLHYQMVKNGGDTPAIGTPLASWHQDQPDVFGENQMLELQILKFQTVEQVATASDAQLQRIGMGAAGLRERARAYMAMKNGSTVNDALAARDDEIAALKSQMAELMAMMSDKRGPGRPRKADADGQLNADVGDAGHG
jgi:hypothetical protein